MTSRDFPLSRLPELEQLCAMTDVTCELRPAGQVLVYQGHLPAGLVVVVSGRLVMHDDAAAAEPEEYVVTASDRPLLLPALDELEQRASRRVETAARAAIVFVPRTLLPATKILSGLVERGRLRVLRMQPESRA